MTHEESQAVTEGEGGMVAAPAHAEVPPPPPDDQNPAIFDARKTFIITVICALLFIGAVVLFIL